MVVVDDEAFRRLPGTIAIARAGMALAGGDVTCPEVIELALHALLPEALPRPAQFQLCCLCWRGGGIAEVDGGDAGGSSSYT
ncbi:MAG TPA: hypothetical protein VFU22_11520 [Roseiflexaceae bacterium]|nr:hypothetical protein [Roseiflexaceae bacterium]